jgi:hypothetical protein
MKAAKQKKESSFETSEENIQINLNKQPKKTKESKTEELLNKEYSKTISKKQITFEYSLSDEEHTKTISIKQTKISKDFTQIQKKTKFDDLFSDENKNPKIKENCSKFQPTFNLDSQIHILNQLSTKKPFKIKVDSKCFKFSQSQLALFSPEAFLHFQESSSLLSLKLHLIFHLQLFLFVLGNFTHFFMIKLQLN